MLMRNTLLYLPAQVIGPVAQFAAIILFTHLMAPEPYGTLTYVIASQEFVFLLSLSWWSTYTIRYFSSHAAEETGRYQSSEVPILLRAILVQVAASFLSLLLIWPQMSVPLVVASVFYTVTRSLNMHLGERARAQNLILDYTIAASAGPVFGFALALAAIRIYPPSATVALVSYGLVQAIALSWQMRRQDLRLTLRRPDPALLRQALTFGVPLVAAGVAAWFSTNTIRVLVANTMGAAQMGLLAVGWSLGNRLMATASMFVTVAAFPLAVESLRLGARAEAFRQITRNGVLMLGIILPMGVGLLMIQRPVIDLVVAAPYREMTLLILPAALAAGLFRNIRTHVADQIFLLVERTMVVCFMAVLEAGCVVAGCIAGLVLEGVAGAAYGSAGGYAAAALIHFAFARRRVGMAVPFQDAALVVGAVAVMAGTLALSSSHELFPDRPVAAIGAKVLLGVTAYGCAILVFFPSMLRGLRIRLKSLPARWS